MVQISHDILTYINVIFLGLTLGNVELVDKIRSLQAKDIYTFLLQTVTIIFKKHNKTTTFSLKKKKKTVSPNLHSSSTFSRTICYLTIGRGASPSRGK